MSNHAQTQPASTQADVVYRGYGPGRGGGGRLVIIEIGGEIVGPLPHRVKHSPTGMTWGYSGSGPADLARSLLIHALGDAARCSCDPGSSGLRAAARPGHLAAANLRSHSPL